MIAYRNRAFNTFRAVLGALAVSAFICQAQSAEPIWIDKDLSSGNNGLIISARNINDTVASSGAVGRHREGIGAAGRQASAPAIKDETGFDPIKGVSEEIIIQFGQSVLRANLDLTYFYPHETEYNGVAYNERGGWRAYLGDTQVDRGMFISNAEDGNYRLAIRAKMPFDRLELFATPYINAKGSVIPPGKRSADSSDFLIKHIAYQPLHHQTAGAENEE